MAPSATTEIKSSPTVDSLSSKHRRSQRQMNQKPATGSTPSTPSKVVANSTVTVTPNSTQNPLRVDLSGEEDASVSTKDSLLEMDESKEPLLDVLIDQKHTDP